MELYQHESKQFVDAVTAVGNDVYTKIYLFELLDFPNFNYFHTGIINGAPLLDNLLVDSETFKVSALVDFEDACVGPVVFDIAAAIAGS